MRSALDNTIAGFHELIDRSGNEPPIGVWEAACMLTGYFCALGHARRYLREGLQSDGYDDSNSSVTVDADGKIVVGVTDKGAARQWVVLRWFNIKEPTGVE